MSRAGSRAPGKRVHQTYS